jgi:glucose-1-phosphate cytidylyltransferase
VKSSVTNMKAVILAGGLGSRLSEETVLKPKPMVEVGGMPLLWHIMKIYSHHGINDFVICLGYKGYVIKQFFADYYLHVSDLTFDLRSNSKEVHENASEPWRVTLVDTGMHSMTGGRLRRVRKYVGDQTFCMTYGDGVGDIDVRELVRFHRAHGKAATLTATQPPGRFGRLTIHPDTRVGSFEEKPTGDGAYVNGGFFVLEPKVFDLLRGDDTIWEREPLERLAQEGELFAYKHRGFWQPMDHLRDKRYLEELWESGRAPWKTWD